VRKKAIGIWPMALCFCVLRNESQGSRLINRGKAGPSMRI